MPACSAPAPTPGMRFGASHNRGGNPNARKPCTFRTGNYQLEGGTAHSACPSMALSGTPLFVSEDACIPVASLSNNSAKNSFVNSPLAPTPSVDNFYGAVPTAGESTSSVVPLSQVISLTARTCAFSDVPLGHDLSSASGTRASSYGDTRSKHRPHQPSHESLRLARSPPMHAPRSNIAAVTARRHFRRTCSSPPLSEHAVAVGSRCGTADPQKRFLITRWRPV